MKFVKEKKRELKVEEERFTQKAFVSSVAIGKAGLGYYTITQIDRNKEKEWIQFIQEEVWAEIEEAMISKMINQS